MKKGFTLIELLAVIAILAIILLIAVPNVLTVLENAKINTFSSSARMLIDTAETYAANGGVTTNNIAPSKGFVVTSSQLEAAGYLSDNSNIINSVVVFYNNAGTLESYVYATDGEYIVDGYMKNDVSSNVTTGTHNYIVETMGISNYTFNSGKLSFIPTLDTSGANAPTLLTGLIPVYFDSGVWKKADVNNVTPANQWYDYTTFRWANAVTVTTATRVAANAAVPGTTIADATITAFYVWIPKFEYRIQGTYGLGGSSLAAPGEIEVSFIDKTTLTPTSGYKIHPAFAFNNVLQAGLWVGKFETTGTTSAATILPNVTPIRNQTLSNLFSAARNMESVYNTYGFVGSELDVHMNKAKEWGAITYLSHSKYGKYGNSSYVGANKQLYINNHSTYNTGCSAGAPSSLSNAVCAYPFPNNTLSGTGASTSGTIYGVYDLNGGSYEYVMANYNSTLGSSGFGSLPAAQYYDTYTTTTEATACGGAICYGEAISETMDWYGDYSGFISAGSPWLARGAAMDNSTNAGAFAYIMDVGAGAINYSFRITLTSDF